MNTTTVQVFVSSTLLDLQDERKAVETIIHRFHEIKFVGMEYFGSRDETTCEVSLAEVNRSHLYIGIFGGRYGSGITEAEYRQAREIGLPCLIYIKRQEAISPDGREADVDNMAKLDMLKSALRKAHTYSEFSTADDLAIRVTADLHRWLFDEYLPLIVDEQVISRGDHLKAQQLLDAILDHTNVNQNLLHRLQQVVVNVASGERSVAAQSIINSTVDTSTHYHLPQNTRLFSTVPPLPSLIIGRDQALLDLKTRLGISATPTNQSHMQVLTAVRGWPGVGKTTIAAALAHDQDVATAFPDGVLWTSLGQEPDLLAELSRWGRALKCLEIMHVRDVSEASNLLAGVLREKRMLLIIDDVWHHEHAILFKIGGRQCATLVTTRLSDVAYQIAPTPESVYPLAVLTEDDAVSLLRELAPEVVAQCPDASRLLVRELEGLPLAIQVAGRLLHTENRRGFGVETLLEELREGARLLEEKAPPDRSDVANQTTPTIAALLDKSTNFLDDITLERFAYLGPFAPKPATFDAEAMAYVWETKDPRATISALVDRGLLEYVKEIGRYQMHALLVAHATSLLTD